MTFVCVLTAAAFSALIHSNDVYNFLHVQCVVHPISLTGSGDELTVYYSFNVIHRVTSNSGHGRALSLHQIRSKLQSRQLWTCIRVYSLYKLTVPS